jgi:crotonobetainyl-CoA:carnitine CoA-transferase CaiB-like acyl-CoA transferase
MLRDPRFIDLEHRIEHGNALITELASAFKAKSFAEWRAKFHGWDAPWELVQNIKELAADPQAKANDYLFTVQVADGTDVAVVAGPVAFNGSATPTKPLRSPDLGQHSEEILRRIGVSAEQLQDLKGKNIVR